MMSSAKPAMMQKSGDPFSLRPGARTVFVFAVAVACASVFGGALEAASAWRIIPILAALFLMSVYRRKLATRQLLVNVAASKVLQTQDKFILYLRPFMFAGKLRSHISTERLSDAILLGSSWDVELAFTLALEGKRHLVALGHVEGELGSAQLEVRDEDWQDRVMELADRAVAIIIIPLARPGTLWEVRYLYSHPDLLRKTLFIMPPAGMLRALLWRALKSSVRSSWRRARHELSNSGILLTPYRRKGGIFKIEGSGDSTILLPARKFAPSWIDKLIWVCECTGKEVTGLERLSGFDAFPIWDRVRYKFKEVVGRACSEKGATAIAILAALIIRSLVIEPFNIPSGSSIPTLLIGDYMFVSKFSFGYAAHSFGLGLPLFSGRISIPGLSHMPERGDVIVFKLPTDNSTDYVKRLIGLPGDHIQMKKGILYINDQPCQRKRIEDFLYSEGNGAVITLAQYFETLPNGVQHRIIKMGDNGPLDNTQVYNVPPGEYFMMGDNRDNSMDSRILSAVGYIPFENLLGKAQFIFFSTDGSAHWWEVWKWPFAIRYNRLFTSIH
jgi:signal peptidase I